MTEVKGYKAFNPDWTCKKFKYEVGKTYEMNEMPVICERGFHFCENLADCFGITETRPGITMRRWLRAAWW